MANRKKTTGLTLANSLKKSLLQSAIMGKLVPQNDDDGNAQDLLTQIQNQKQSLIKDGKLKKEKPLAPITDDEKPFEIPDNWVWVRLGDIGIIQTGTTPSKSDDENYGSDFPFFKPADLSQNENIVNASEFLSNKGKQKARIALKYSILINGIGNIGNLGILKTDGAFNQQMHALTTLNGMDYKLAYYFLSSPFVQSEMKDNSSQTTLPILNKSKFENIIIPLPPLAEQARIVAKLDEIVPKIDELAMTETALNALNAKFPKQMQSALLQSAIMGKLVPQNSDDGNAQDLLTQIQTEKQSLIQDGKLKKEKPLAPITDDEKPFEIPDNWVWVRLGEIGTWNSGATPSRTESKYYSNATVNWLKTGDLNDGVINETSEKITELALQECSVKLQPIGAVLMAMYGATIGKVGLLNIETTTNQACCACVPFNGVLNWYLFYFLIANRSNFIAMGAGGAQPNISKEKIVNTLIPLPPLAEQARIVAKLDELLPKVRALDEWVG